MIPTIYELTLRDGLMARPQVDRASKVKLVERLFLYGIRNFEVVRFPIDGKYPQFDDAIPLLKEMQSFRQRGATLAAFAMGEAGIKEALNYSSLYDQLHIPCFVSDAYAAYAFGDWNWDKSLFLVANTLENCQRAKIDLTIGLGTCFGCPLQRSFKFEQTVQKFQEIVDLGIECIMLGDTAGTATPALTEQLLLAVKTGPSPKNIRVHFHNTFGRALLNTWAALRAGADGIDTSLLGLGGESHPYFVSPGQVDNGNCATEEIYPLLMPIDSQENPAVAGILETSRWFAGILGEDVPGRAGFAELICWGNSDNDEIPQGSYRH